MATAEMAKKKLFTEDFEVHASTKMLYPYIQTASGLSEWFADDVKINNMSKVYTFVWDHEDHKAKQVAHRTNHFVRFEYLESVYLKVTDYSDFDDHKELHDLWHGLIDQLKKTVGG
jgi:hypothetical protein